MGQAGAIIRYVPASSQIYLYFIIFNKTFVNTFVKLISTYVLNEVSFMLIS